MSDSTTLKAGEIIRYEGTDIVIGPNNGIRIDNVGRVFKAVCPVFWAWQSGGGFSTTINVPIPFGLTTINIGSCYSTSLHRFTAPVAGVYEFHGSLLHRQTNVTGAGEWGFYKNGNRAMGSNRGLSYGGGGSADGDHDTTTAMIYIQLAENDFIDMRINAISASQDFYYGDGLAHFAGRLIA